LKKPLTLLLEKTIQQIKDRGHLALDPMPSFSLELPKRPGMGDISTTLAMTLASHEKKQPHKIAELIIQNLPKDQELFDKVEIAGPGYINFTFRPVYWYETLKDIEKHGEQYGWSSLGAGKRVQVEFVSANPTGPLHVGHGRGAAVGDVLAHLLTASGYQVEREYYINDVGTQIDTLGRSVHLRYREVLGQPSTLPEGAYQGSYIREIAQEMAAKDRGEFLDRPEAEAIPHFTSYAYRVILRGIEQDLERFGIRFDRWFSERSLYEDKEVEQAITELEKRGFLYEQEGAKWVKTTALGDDKDRVVVRANGQMTYFASDIAYHRNKFRRGFDRTINIWGADHHGYVPRVKAVVEMLGHPASSLVVLLVQLVNLLRAGKAVAMSTRAGEFVTLREVMEEVGVDAARYIFLTRRSDTPLDFDLEVAKKQSDENPVYYIQYAHARLASVQRQAKEQGLEIPAVREVRLERLVAPEEKALMRQLAFYPDLIEESAIALEPHRLTFYLHDLAALLHNYYYQHRIISEDLELSRARLVLVTMVKTVIKNALGILGVSAPERM
jgi:arginyl-tRNA synthetase